jgi:hypothetical protein
MGPTEQTFQKLVAQPDYPTFIATVATDGQLTFHRAKRIDPGHEA